MTPKDPDKFTDALLEEALSSYANVPPPAGLERRILSRLTRQRANRQRLLRGLGVTLVAMVVVTAAAQRFGTHMAFVGPTATVKDEAPVAKALTRKSTVVLPVVLDTEPRRVRAAAVISARRDGPIEQERIVRTSLISDLQLDSLNLSPLDLPALSSVR